MIRLFFHRYTKEPTLTSLFLSKVFESLTTRHRKLAIDSEFHDIKIAYLFKFNISMKP